MSAIVWGIHGDCSACRARDVPSVRVRASVFRRYLFHECLSAVAIPLRRNSALHSVCMCVGVHSYTDIGVEAYMII